MALYDSDVLPLEDCIPKKFLSFFKCIFKWKTGWYSL